ncbi:MAG: pyridoxal-phosphate dependent enzyme, partial [Paracoccaceae bacterium]
VQAEGCAPIVNAWRQGKETAELWENANTIAAGIRVPVAVGDFLIIRAVNESKGFAISVSDDEIVKARDLVSKTEGTLLCPEGAATLAAFKKSLSDGLISKNDRVVLFNCASGLKYSLPDIKNTLNKDQPLDYSIF